MRPPVRASGFMLLEALVAILVFSLAILGVIAFQATSSRLTTDAAFRTEASLYAEELIARMMLSDSGNVIPHYSSATAGPQFVAWRDTRLVNLPGSAATVTISPDPTGLSSTFVAQIQITWLPPGASNAGDYVYETTTLLEY